MQQSQNPFAASLKRVEPAKARPFLESEAGVDPGQIRAFDYEYDHKASRENPSLMQLKLTQGELDAMLQAAKQAGINEGHTQAMATAQASQAQQQTDAICQISAKLDQAIGEGMARLEVQAADAAELSLVTARTLATQLLARFPEDQIVGLLQENIEQLRTMPNLIVRVHPDLCDVVQAKIEEFSQLNNLDNPPMLMPDPQVAWGDARIDWSDGCIMRDYKHTLSKIEASTRAFSDAKHAAAKAKNAQIETSSVVLDQAKEMGLDLTPVQEAQKLSMSGGAHSNISPQFAAFDEVENLEEGALMAAESTDIEGIDT